MLSKEARELVNDLLEIFAQFYRIPVAIYEKNELGETVTIAKANMSFFPPHCHAIWDLAGSDTPCRQDMLRRSKEGFDSREPLTMLCHAGLTTEVHPLVIKGEVVAILQFGAYRLTEENDDSNRQELHKKAMTTLMAGSDQAEKIKALLFDNHVVRTNTERDQISSTLPPILTKIIYEYLKYQEKEFSVRKAGFHDVQVHLQAALAEAENLAADLKEPEKKNLDGINEGAENVLGTIDAAGMVLQNLTRGEYLPEKYRFEPHNLQKCLRQAIALCRPVAKRKQIEIITELKSDRGAVIIDASALHLQQAFNNLIHNAVKYSYRSISARSLADQGNRFVSIQGSYLHKGYKILIRNYGVGIDLDEYESIFTEGYKGRHTRAEYRTGAGQGLALTKRIIAKHNGTITVHSRPVSEIKDINTPYLTEFAVWLPLKQSPQA